MFIVLNFLGNDLVIVFFGLKMINFSSAIEFWDLVAKGK
jgi:hypothetical protein